MNTTTRSPKSPTLTRGHLRTIPVEIAEAAARLAAKWQSDGRPIYIELHRPGQREGLWFDYESLDESYLGVLQTTIDYHIEHARRSIDRFAVRGGSPTTAARHIMLARLYRETAARIEDRELSEQEMPFPVMTVDEAEVVGRRGAEGEG